MRRPDPDTQAWASAAVRHVAAVTNLLVAGRRFRIVGAGDPAADPRDAAALHALLVGLGARPAEEHEPIDQLWCLGEPATSQDAIEREADRPRGATLVVVDAGRHLPAVDEDALGPTMVVRPGVLGVPMTSADVFLVSTGREAEDDPAAEARIRWARRAMPVSRAAAAELRDGGLLRGTRVGVAMVLEPKTAVLALLLREAGAEVAVYAHADETDDAVARSLRQQGLVVHADSRATPAEQKALALAMLDTRPHILLDDGAHVIRLAHEERPDLLPTMLGAAEETTSGLRPLRTMAERGDLGIPVVAVNDARTKTLFDNRYGTGQSCVFAVADLLDRAASDERPASGTPHGSGERPDPVRRPASVATHRVRSGGTACVIGFGPVGEGVAMVLTALGLRVTVADSDPVRALQAVFAGYAVAPVRDAVADVDLVMSATGVQDTVSLDVLRSCAPGAVVAVAGGAPQEVALDAALAAGAVLEPVAHAVDRLAFDDGPGLLLLDRGGCINVTAAEGNPVEIMDLSFAVQLGAVRMLLERGDELDRAVVPIDPAVDEATARGALAALGSRAEPPGSAVPPDGADGFPAQPAERDRLRAGADVRTTRFDG